LRLLLMMMVEGAWCWELNLLHVNDIHARMEETNKYSAGCRIEDKERGKCYGGIARLYTAVQDMKKNNENTLWLNAGDFYQGTVWYSHFKWKVISRFNNLLHFDAMALGNHEFDDGVDGLEPFLRASNCPIVAANIDVSREPLLSNLVDGHVVIPVGNRNVGIVGYVTRETPEVSRPGKVTFTDEIEAVKHQVSGLVAEGIDVIIALGHSGYEKDIEIAECIPEIDVIIGGHSHSFLWDYKGGPNPSVERVDGPYPTVIKNRTLVVQAYAYTKYLGNLNINFSNDGKILSWSGEPILLDKKYKEDLVVLKELEPWKKILDKIGHDVIGSTDVLLARSREGESNIGDLLTDAMVWAHRDKDIRLAIVPSGGIRASFDKGKITMFDLLASFPFRNTFDVVILRGETLRKIFKHSVSQMKKFGRNDSGRFLQVSGFRLTYEMGLESTRLALVEVRCPDCPLQWKPLEDDAEYEVVMTDYLAQGGDAYSIIPQEAVRHLQGPLDTDILKEYIRSRSPLRNKVEGRILVVKEKRLEESEEGRAANLSLPDTSCGDLLSSSVLCILCALIIN